MLYLLLPSNEIDATMNSLTKISKEKRIALGYTSVLNIL